MLETDIRIIQHGELVVTRAVPLQALVETVHSMTLSTQPFNNEHTHFVVDHFKATEEIESPVFLLFFSQLLSVQLGCVFEEKTIQVDPFELSLEVLNYIW